MFTFSVTLSKTRCRVLYWAFLIFYLYSFVKTKQNNGAGRGGKHFVKADIDYFAPFVDRSLGYLETPGGPDGEQHP